MKSIQHYFDTANNDVFDELRQNKLNQLKRKVYSKKLKNQRNKNRSSNRVSQLYQCKQIQKTNSTNKEGKSNQCKVRRSKSQFILKFQQQNKQQTPIKKNIYKNNFLVTTLSIGIPNQKLNINCIDQEQNYKSVNPLQKNNVIGNYYQKMIKTHKNFFKKVEQEQQTQKINFRKTKYTNHEFNTKPNIIKQKILNQKTKNDKFEYIHPQMNQLQKNRKRFQSQIFKQTQIMKKQSLIRKNALFLANFLRQKVKKSIDKSPHINNMIDTANQIKIQQNLSLKRILESKSLKKLAQQSIQKQQNTKAIFNSIKIDPW